MTTIDLTPTEIEELRIAIAESVECNCGYGQPSPTGRMHHLVTCPRELPYTTSIDSIREAAMEKSKTKHGFATTLDKELFYNIRSEEEFIRLKFELTALDWAIAFARTAKIWRYKV